MFRAVASYIAIMLCTSVEELRAITPKVPGSIPGMTYIFFCYFYVWGVILVHSTKFRIEFAATLGTPPACRFGLLCSCILRSHAILTKGTFRTVAESCVLIFRRRLCADFGVLVYEKKISFAAVGMGVTLLSGV